MNENGVCFWRAGRALTGKRGGTEARMHVPRCHVPRGLSPERCSPSACPPLIPTPSIGPVGGAGWEEGVKFLCFATFLLKMSSLFCLN